ncbi:MAG: ribulose-phosphate 3-epimerase [Chloroflexi bacterium]|nr:ribulose-phosphate 3-epimerase [Chloroflexota bacterium]
MTLPIRVSTSLLAADFTRLGQQITAAEAAGADWIHIDVMDGVFVPNISFGLPVIQAARRTTSLPLDVHLMIVQPERHIEAVVKAGADWVTVHAEACPHLHRVIQQIREAGAHPGVAINPHLPAVMIQDILPFVDLVLVMTVNPGYGGQQFIPQTLAKIRQVREMAKALGRSIEVEVDGGIAADTTAQVVAHGANVLVAGTSVFGAPEGISAGIAALKNAAVRQISI